MSEVFGLYHRDGTPAEPHEIGDIMEIQDRVVEKTRMLDGVLVSTVFLGIDHSFGNGPPVLFETMVFGGPLDQCDERYETELEARKGHRRWIQAVEASSRGYFDVDDVDVDDVDVDEAVSDEDIIPEELEWFED